MYMSPKSERSVPFKHIFETCHDLDLCRCYPSDKMTRKLDALARHVGQPECDKLARTAEAAIRATGDLTLALTLALTLILTLTLTLKRARYATPTLR